MKFVNVTYGLKGDTKQYTYIVNDNVKVGQVIFPSFRHLPDGKITATVGIVQTTNRVTSKEGISMARLMEEKGIVANYIALNSKNIRDNKQRDEKGQFVGGTGYSKTEKNEYGLYASTTPENYENAPSQKKDTMQELNIQLANNQEQSNKRETFDSYVNQYFDVNSRKG